MATWSNDMLHVFVSLRLQSVWNKTGVLPTWEMTNDYLVARSKLRMQTLLMTTYLDLSSHYLHCFDIADSHEGSLALSFTRLYCLPVVQLHPRV